MIYDNTHVRRQDRLLEESAARELLKRGEYGILSMVDAAGGGYGVPISYVWDGEGSVYIHCAREGHKLRSMEADPRVTLTVVGRTQLRPEQLTTGYESIILRGRIGQCTEEAERMHALELLCRKYAPEHKQWRRAAEASSARTAILRMEIAAMSGKQKKII